MAKFRCAACQSLCGFVNMTKSRDADIAAWKERNGHVCDACTASQRAKAAEEAAHAAQAAGLPALQGSPAQTAWAEQLRAKMLPLLDQAADRIRPLAAEPGPRQPMAADALLALELARAKDRASWWIDHRSMTPEAIARSMLPEVEAEKLRRATAPATDEEAAAEAAALAEALLRPAGEPTTPHVVELRHVGATLRAVLPVLNDSFREVMHANGFRWQQAGAEWLRALHPERSGDPVDRLAEVAQALIAAGFVVRVNDETARARAAAGTFQPERRRWIDVSAGPVRPGWFLLLWRRPDDLYHAARQIVGSRYKDGAVYAPPGSADEVADFADLHDMVMTRAAAALVEQHRAALAAGAVVIPKMGDDRVPVLADAPPAVPVRLAKPDRVEIDPDLMDSD